MAKKGGIQGYTVQEAQNSALGQAGSTYNDNSPDDTLVPPTGSVFVAITMLEDTVFEKLRPTDTTNGYGVGSYNGNTMASETIPQGVTIYGRWNSIDLTSGLVIAYIG